MQALLTWAKTCVETNRGIATALLIAAFALGWFIKAKVF